MSGGSFNYACFKLQDGECIEVLDELRDMERMLRARRKHDAADLLFQSILRIETYQRQLQVIGAHLYDLAYGAEWWQSGDWGEDGFDEMWQESYLQEKESKG